MILSLYFHYLLIAGFEQPTEAHILPHQDFTVSERIEIGRAVEETLKGRVGRPEKVQKKAPDLLDDFDEEIVQNFAQLEGKKTIEIAAEKAGFGNKETYRQAKKVVDEGAPELVEKVDQGKGQTSNLVKILPKLKRVKEHYPFFNISSYFLTPSISPYLSMYFCNSGVSK